jgi:Tfp pilus assembly protein PilO
MPKNFKQHWLRILLGGLVAANLIAAGMLLFPPGGSAEELEKELANLQSQAAAKRSLLEKTRQHVVAVEQGRSEGDQFLGNYFLPLRGAPALLLSELGHAASGSKINDKGASITYSTIDGSDTLSMMSITANYEGNYSDLMHFVHELDRSSRLMIIESLNAAPQTDKSGMLAVAMKLDTFVRDDTGALAAVGAPK